MEELAQAAGVSRRTLFNYFDSKLDAVLGPELELCGDLADEFRAGGPTGHLLTDLGHLAHGHFAQTPQNREEIARSREVMANPRILAAVHQRFEHLAGQVLAMIQEREAGRYDEVRARVTLGLLVVLCQVALDSFLAHADDERTFTDHYDDALSTIHTLLA